MNKAIYIEWVDSASTDKWVPIDAADGQVLLVETIGWLVREWPKTIEITSSWSTGNHIMGILAIPKCAILKRHYLKEIKRSLKGR